MTAITRLDGDKRIAAFVYILRHVLMSYDAAFVLVYSGYQEHSVNFHS